MDINNSTKHEIEENLVKEIITFVNCSKEIIDNIKSKELFNVEGIVSSLMKDTDIFCTLCDLYNLDVEEQLYNIGEIQLLLDWIMDMINPYTIPCHQFLKIHYQYTIVTTSTGQSKISYTTYELHPHVISDITDVEMVSFMKKGRCVVCFDLPTLRMVNCHHLICKKCFINHFSLYSKCPSCNHSISKIQQIQHMQQMQSAES